MLISRLLLSSAVLSISTSGILAQQPASRIAGPIDDSQLVTLVGNTPPAAIAPNDRGPVNPALRLTDLILVLRRSPDEQAAFDAFVASQYDPASPNYHLWLAPADVGARFGPSAADVAGVSQWLALHGLAVEAVAPDRMTIRFGGTAAQVQAAFHTTLHNLSVDGEAHVANLADPQIPAALGPVVLGVKALHNFLPRPQHRLGSRVTLDPTTGRWQRTTSSAIANPALGGISPDLGITIGSGSSAYTIEDVAPYDFATIYNVLPLWNAGTPIDGAGQTIAIAGTSDINLTDVAGFRQVFGLPAGTPPKIVVANGVDPGQCTGTTGACTIDDLYENSLDVEWSGAVAKGASIVLVVSGQTSPMTDTVYSSANYVVQNQTAKILSVSYGECELGLGTAGNAAYNNLWETAATEGIAVFVASGDSGSAACDQGLAQALPYTAQYGLTVSGLASTPFNTAVGGTDLNWGTTAAPYWNSSNKSSTGASAAGYMPEIPWNDTCSNPVLLPILQEWATALQKAGYSPTSPTDAESACNFATTWDTVVFNGTNGQVELDALVNTVGGGGGASNCTASDGTTVASCTGGYAKPAWQARVSGIPADGKRDLPDVSFFAGNGLLGSAYLVCVSAAASCVSSTSPTTEPVAQEVGGTSAGTPAMAGVMALINQKIGATQGSPNAELYAIAAKQSYGSCSSETAGGNCSFHDIDQGTIAMPCRSGALDCTVTQSGDSIGLLSGYNAGAGFDNASGLGSLNVANVVNAWTSTVGTTPATVTVKPAQNGIAMNQSLSVAVQVSGSSGTPTGNVTIASGGYDGGAQALASGSYTFTIPANSLPAGSLTITGSYAGDATYAEASGTAGVTVTKLTPTVTVTPTPSTVGANTPVTVAVTVSGASGLPTPTGDVKTTASSGSWGASCTLASGTCAVTIPANTLSNDSVTLSTSYSGDDYYQSATGSVTETVTALTPKVTLNVSPSSFSTSAGFQVTGSVTGAGSLPTGSITIGGLARGVSTAQISGGSFSISIPPFSVDKGTSSITAAYSGDTAYFPATATAAVSVTATISSLTVTPSASTIFSNAPLTLAGIFSGGSFPPNGWVSVSVGGYYDQVAISNDAYSLSIPGGTLAVGSNTLTVNYTGDLFYSPSSATTSVTVNPWVKVPPTVTVTPQSSTTSVGDMLNVVVTVSGADGTPSGTVTLPNAVFLTEGYPLSPGQLMNGKANFYFPPNTLAVGSDTLTATYSGDITYLGGTGTSTITVNTGAFTLMAGSSPKIPAGQQGDVAIFANTSSGYSGQITLACALTNQPSGAMNPPTCTGATIQMSGASNEGTVTVSTTGGLARNSRPPFPGLAGFGGAALAFLCFLGIPARRRGWRNLLGILVLIFVFSSLGACGGGGGGGSGGGGGGGGGSSSGTTAGTYTFTVTGTGSPAVTPAPTTMFTVTVN